MDCIRGVAKNRTRLSEFHFTSLCASISAHADQPLSDKNSLVRLRHGAHVPCCLEGTRKEEGGGPQGASLTLASGMDFLKLFASLETALPRLLKVLSTCSLNHLQSPQGSQLPVSHQATSTPLGPKPWPAAGSELGPLFLGEPTPTGPVDTDVMSLWSRHRAAIGEGPASGL